MAVDPFRYKRFLPRSLFSRALLILVLPIVLLQMVLTLVIIQRHYDRVTVQMAETVASGLALAVDAVETAPDPEAAGAALARIAPPLGLELGLRPGTEVVPLIERAWYDLTGRVIAETFEDQLRRPLAIDFVSVDKQLTVLIPTSLGALEAVVPRRRANASNPHQLLLWMVAAAVPLTLIAVLFLRNQMRPIRQLANAAAAFGRGRSTPFRPSGAEEVRRAGHAFLDMRARLERQIEQRTAMLSGVSHDLRTPLTRMKLALAVAEEGEETQDLVRDVAEMERMVEGFLAFARGEEGEPAIPVDAVGLVEAVAADARRQGEVVSVVTRIDTADARDVELKPQAMRRCILNLVNNAAAHGSEIRLTVRLTPRTAEFTVEDDGPGIPEASREEMLRPFTRGDSARGQNITSGVGLGLSIALDIARSHGGSLTLDESDALGGLRAKVMIPR